MSGNGTAHFLLKPSSQRQVQMEQQSINNSSALREGGNPSQSSSREPKSGRNVKRKKSKNNVELESSNGSEQQPEEQKQQLQQQPQPRENRRPSSSQQQQQNNYRINVNFVNSPNNCQQQFFIDGLNDQQNENHNGSFRIYMRQGNQSPQAAVQSAVVPPVVLAQPQPQPQQPRPQPPQAAQEQSPQREMSAHDPDSEDFEEQKSQKQLIKNREPQLHVMFRKNSQQNSKKSKSKSSKSSKNNNQQEKSNFNISFNNQDVFSKKVRSQSDEGGSPISSSSDEQLPIQRGQKGQPQGLMNQRNKKKKKQHKSVEVETDGQIALMKKFETMKNKIAEVNETVQICYFASRYGLQYKNILDQNERMQKQHEESKNVNLAADEEFKSQEGLMHRSKTPNPISDQLQNNSLKQSKSLEVQNITEQKQERARINNEFKNIIQSNLNFNQKYNFANEKEAYRNLQNTKRRKVRGEIGPKQMNNFDRQQINQFMSRIEQQNVESKKRVMYVNHGIHQLLRGAQAPEVIQEEENEASQSVNMALQYSIERGHQPQRSYIGNQSNYSSMIDPEQLQQQQVGKARVRNTNTSSMLAGSLMNKNFSQSQLDVISNNSRSQNSHRSSNISSQNVSNKKKHKNSKHQKKTPIFIICNDQAEKSQENQLNNLNPQQIECILKQYNQMRLQNNNSSRGSQRSSNHSDEQLDICNIQIDENQQVSIWSPQNQGKIRINNFTFNKCDTSQSEDLDETPHAQKRSLMAFQEIIHENDDESSNHQSISCKSNSLLKNYREAERRNSQGIGGSGSLHDLGVGGTAQFALLDADSSNRRKDSSDLKPSSGKRAIIIDNKDISGFMSNRKLKQKANEKKLENNFKQQDQNIIKQLIEDEKDKSDAQSKMSRRSLISNQNLQRIKEEEAGFSQSIAVKLKRKSGSVDGGSSDVGSQIEEVLDQMLSGSQDIKVCKFGKKDSASSQRKNQKKKLAEINEQKNLKLEEEKEFLNKQYIRQQSQNHLRLIQNKLLVQNELEKTFQNSEDLYSHHFSSEDSVEPPIKKPLVQKQITKRPMGSLARNKKDSSEESQPCYSILNTTQDEAKQSTDKEVLYDYDAREKKLLAKVIKYMRPSMHNRIWNKIFVQGAATQQQDIYKAIDRMAFERDPERQIRVSILDYNSLEQYYGPITFTDGMSFIKFNGKRIQQKQPKKKKSQSFSCTSFFKKQLQNFEQLNISNVEAHSIKTNTIIGLIYGPNSVTFKQYLKNNFRDKKIMSQRCDQWRYISIITQFQSYDLILSTMEDAFDLIVSINEALIKQNDQELRKQSEKIQKLTMKQIVKRQIQDNNSNTNLLEKMTDEQCEEYKRKSIELLKKELTMQNKVIKLNTSKKILKFEMLRRKMISMAEDLGYTLSQYLIVTIYNTVCDQEEKTEAQIDTKLARLKNLINIIKSHPKLKDVLEVFDFETQLRLQRHKHKLQLMKIMKMTEEERQMHLKLFFQNHQLFGLSRPQYDDTTTPTQGGTQTHGNTLTEKDKESLSNSIDSIKELNFNIQKFQTQTQTPTKSKMSSSQIMQDDHGKDDGTFLAVIVEQNQSYEVSSTSNCKDKGYIQSSPKGQVMKQLNINLQQEKQKSETLPPLQSKNTISDTLTPLTVKTPLINQNSPATGTPSRMNSSKDAWKKWLVGASDKQTDEQRKALTKKIRSLKFLDRLKEKRKKREQIERELKQIEAEGKRKNKVQSFFNHNLLSLIRKGSTTNLLRSQQSSSNEPYGRRPQSPENQQPLILGNEFNYHSVTQAQLLETRKEIIKWTKNQYCKENRIVHLDKYTKAPAIDENMLKKLTEQDDDSIIQNQAYIANEIKLINRSGKLDQFRALPVTSIFAISTGNHQKEENVNLDFLESKGMTKLLQLQEYENSLTINEYLALRAKTARTANIEWKYEYRRQQNLFKKLIEVSIKKREFDNMPEEEKKKYLVNKMLENQKSDGKGFKNLFEDKNGVVHTQESSSPEKKPIQNSATKRLKKIQLKSKSKSLEDKSSSSGSSQSASSSSVKSLSNSSSSSGSSSSSSSLSCETPKKK